jgi:hypothetical protein
MSFLRGIYFFYFLRVFAVQALRWFWLKGTGFSPYIHAANDCGLYRLRKNYQMAEVLKGHGFSRAASG